MNAKKFEDSYASKSELCISRYKNITEISDMENTYSPKPIPNINLHKIKEIMNCKTNSLINLIGIVDNIGDLDTNCITKFNKITCKRVITVYDEDNIKINCTVWDKKVIWLLINSNLNYC